MTAMSAPAQVTPPPTLRLRPYQEEAVAAIEGAARRGVRCPLLVLPTGTGKTIVFVELIRRRGGRALVLAHRDELIQQAKDKLLLTDPQAQIGIVKAGEDDHAAPFVVASVQTLSRPSRLARLNPDFATIVVDEAHHATAPTYQRILQHLGAFTDGGPLCLGVTATAERSDGTPLGDVWEEIVYERDVLEMIGQGYLADLRAVQVQLDADFSSLHSRLGDFIGKEVEELLLDASAPLHAVAAYHEHAPGRKALLFTPTVVVAHAMAEAFSEAGVAAEALDASTPIDERRDMLARFRVGETRVLANCAVLTEGFDEPSADCIIVARPTKSRPLYVQMIGRGTRIHPGKEDCLILDLVGASTRHDLMTCAGLFDLAPDALEDRPASIVTAEKREREEQEATAGQLVAHTVDLFSRRPMHWVRDADRYILSTGDGFITLVQEGARWSVRYLGGEAREELASGLDLGYAQGVAEDYARKQGAATLVNPRASWRALPPTPKQLTALRRWRIKRSRSLTRGEASDLLTAAIAGVAV